MKESVVQFLRRHRIQLIGKTLLVGVSGGPDSIALLHLLSTYVNDEATYIEAITIDHQLRDEAKEDIKYVSKMCKGLDIPLSSVKIDVNHYVKENQVSIQVAARTLRYRAFEQKMFEIKADYLLLGHHGDDQVETLVMNLARSANSASLVGIPFQRDFGGGTIIRPLLSVSKNEINTYCHDYQLNPQTDASNEDTSYTRNDIRKNVIPILRKRNRLLHITGQYLNETLMEDELFMMNKAREVFQRVLNIDKKKNIVQLDREELKKHDSPLQRRVYRLTLDYLYEGFLPNTLSYKHEESFLQIIDHQQNKVIDFPACLRLEKSYERLLFYFAEEKEEERLFQKNIEKVPTNISLPNGDQLIVSYWDGRSAENELSFIIPLNDDDFPYIIRQRQAGDRMQYRGLNGTKKIKDILIDEKIPRNKREEKYLLTSHDGEVLWLIGLRKSEVQIDKKQQLKILFTYERNNR